MTVIFKDDFLYDNFVEKIIEATQRFLKPTPDTKKPNQQFVTNKPVVDAKPSREVVNTAKTAITSCVQNRLSNSHRIQTVEDNADEIQNIPTGSKDAKFSDKAVESGANQFKAKDVRFLQTSKPLNQESSTYIGC